MSCMYVCIWHSAWYTYYMTCTYMIHTTWHAICIWYCLVLLGSSTTCSTHGDLHIAQVCAQVLYIIQVYYTWYHWYLSAHRDFVTFDGVFQVLVTECTGVPVLYPVLIKKTSFKIAIPGYISKTSYFFYSKSYMYKSTTIHDMNVPLYTV